MARANNKRNTKPAKKSGKSARATKPARKTGAKAVKKKSVKKAPAKRSASKTAGKAVKKKAASKPSRKPKSPVKKKASAKPVRKTKAAAKKKPIKRGTAVAKKRASTTKKSKSSAAKAPRKKASSKASKKKLPVKKRGARSTAKTQKSALPAYVPRSQRSSTDMVRVRARFTEPLRRFSPYENLRDLIRGQAEKHGDRTFLIYEDDGREYSFTTLDKRTTQVANVLHELGLPKGARVALLLENSPDFVFAFLGIMKGGFIAVPMNLELGEKQLRFQLEDCGANVVITSADQWGLVSSLLSNLPGLSSALVTGKAERLESLGAEGSHLVDTDGGGNEYRILDFAGCLEAADGETLKTSEIGWWDEAQIVYTGHQLHQPRGAILQHRHFMTSARWLSIWLDLSASQRFMSVLPLFHANAQIVTLFTPLHLGGSVVLSSEFSVSRVWKAVERYKVTTLSAVPSMLGILADRELSEARGAKPPKDVPWPMPHESPGTLAQRTDSEARESGLARGHDISSLERVLCGAAPLPTAVQKKFEQVFLVPVIEGYSMAETTCFAMLNPGNGTRRLGSVGVSVGNKVAVLSNEAPVKPLSDDWGPMSLPRMNPAVFPTAEIGEPGEICVWGENVLKEYFHRPKINPEAFAGGWFHTGDVGYHDADGFFYVGGPKEEEIEREGVKFMPREVDEVLFQHQQVEQAATIGVTNARGGSMVTTWVVMRKGTFPDGPDEGRLPHNDAELERKKEEIRDFLSQHLSAKKRPTSVMFAKSLPSDPTGKTRIIDLRKLSGEASSSEEE